MRLGGFASPTRAAACALTTPFFIAGERFRHDRRPGHFGELQIGLLFLLERFGQQIDNLLFTQRFGERYVGAVGGDFVVLDALHAGNDDEIKDRSLFVVLLDLMLGFLDQTTHRIADLATLRPGRTFIFSMACSRRSICTCV